MCIRDSGYTIRGVQKILREHGPRFVMDHMRLAEDNEPDEAIPPPEIPDIAAEDAQSSSATLTRERGEALAKLDPQKLGTLLDEIEACKRVLSSAQD